MASRHCVVQRPGGAEVAHAGHDDAASPAQLVGRRRHEHVGSDGGQRLLDRRQVAGAVVDERDH